MKHTEYIKPIAEIEEIRVAENFAADGGGDISALCNPDDCDDDIWLRP
jgi:hypothetical protein